MSYQISQSKKKPVNRPNSKKYTISPTDSTLHVPNAHNVPKSVYESVLEERKNRKKSRRRMV